MIESPVEVVTTRQNPLIDPHLHVWGWEIPVYLFLGGLVAGLLILSALVELWRGRKPGSTAIRIMPFLGLTLLSLGMVALFLDLEFKSHVYRFYTAFQPSSPMSWGSWILLVIYPVAALHGIGSLRPHHRARFLGWFGGRQSGLRRGATRLLARLHQKRALVLWLSIWSGVGLGIYTGLLLGTLSARPLWNSTLLGPLFLVSGLSTGAAFMLLFRLDEKEHQALVRWDKIVIAVELILLAFLLLDLSTGTAAAQVAASGLLGGSYTGVFWALVVILGLAVPLILEITETKRRLVPVVIVSVLILIGGFSLRWILLVAGQQAGFGVL